MHFVYVLTSLKDDYKYVGMTKDLSKRLEEHNSGISKSTKAHLPYKIIYYETYENYIDAYHREKYFKT